MYDGGHQGVQFLKYKFVYVRMCVCVAMFTCIRPAQLLTNNVTERVEVYDFDDNGLELGRKKSDMWLEGVAYPLTVDYDRGLLCFYTHALGRCVSWHACIYVLTDMRDVACSTLHPHAPHVNAFM